MPVQIDRGIPVPPRNRAERYPWEALEVGDSFLADGKRRPNTTVAIKTHAPKKFTIRKTAEGWRVWRVA